MSADERWRLVRDLFERAHDEAPADVAAWLDRQGVDDWQVREDVVSLLRHHASAGSFLAEPVGDRLHELIEDDVFEAGRAIGPYALVRELGRGGMGRVYLARDQRLNRLVALKAISPDLAADPAYRERLRREASVAAGLTHPGICVVHALEELDGELFIVSEFIEGRTLREEMRGSRPPVDRVVQTARDLAEALAHAHARGVTHRDLKPENIMRTDDGRVKILDFGLARLESDGGDGPQLTRPGTIVGTLAYMAPEQMNGHRADARSDVWALGVTLYEYASGTHPFLASTTEGQVARILAETPPPLDTARADLPPSVAAVIERCLEKSRADRFASGDEMVQALRRPDGTATGLTRWWRIHQMVLVGLYFVACILAWQIKEWQPGPADTMFLAAGVLATVAGVFRGHLLFVAATNRRRLAAEHARAVPVLLAADLLLAVVLAADGLLLSTGRPLAGVLTLALGVGIALARLVVEPATSSAIRH